MKLDKKYTLNISRIDIEKQTEIDKLIKSNNYKDLFDESGWSALMYAVVHNKINMVNLLIENGANINHQNNRGYTALIYATSEKNLQIVDLLIKNGADLNIKDMYDRTALIMASYGNNIDIFKLLYSNIKNKSLENIIFNLNVENAWGNTVLLGLCYSNFYEAIEYLLENETSEIFNIYKLNNEGKSAYDLLYINESNSLETDNIKNLLLKYYPYLNYKMNKILIKNKTDNTKILNIKRINLPLNKLIVN